MKALIILSALLLIPIVMKFQTQSLLTKSNPQTLSELVAILEREGVQEPQVSLDYLDATIGGFVNSEEKARNIAREVDAVRGVRLVKNNLSIEGWFEVSQRGGQIEIRGLASQDWKNEVLRELPNPITKGLKVSDAAEIPGKSAVSWGLFFDSFFAGQSERSLSYKNGRLRLSGETTTSEFARLQDRVKALGAVLDSQSELTLRPSRFHFSSREIESKIEGEPLRSLSQKLANSMLSFEEAGLALTAESRAQLEELSVLILQIEEGTDFIVGAHPDSSGENLAMKRAREIQKKLIALGVEGKRLGLEPFEMTETESGLQGQVELLVR